MAAQPKPPLSSQIVDASVMTAVQRAVGQQTAIVTQDIADLTISSNEDYHSADLLLVRIRGARKIAEEIFAEKIRTPILEPTRKALDGLYALERELTKTPFDFAEKSVKAKMAEWQNKERQRIEAEKAAARAEELRIAREAEQARQEAERVAANAKTAKQKREAEAAAERARQVAEEAEQAKQNAIDVEQQRAVKGVGSKVTTKRVPIVADFTRFAFAAVNRPFLKAALELANNAFQADPKNMTLKALVRQLTDCVNMPEVPEICLQVNEEVLAEYWKQDAGLVSAWPGVRIDVRTVIGGR